MIPFVDDGGDFFGFRVYGGNVRGELGSSYLDGDASESEGLSGDADVVLNKAEVFKSGVKFGGGNEGEDDDSFVNIKGLVSNCGISFIYVQDGNDGVNRLKD